MRLLLSLTNRIPHSQTKTSSLFQRLAVGTSLKSRFVSTMSSASQFPPEKVKAIVHEVAALLKERGETVSVAETVSFPLFREVKEKL